MKRCVIDNAGRFRISRPGFDVDTADPQDLLLHESFFYSQPFFFRYVACPYSGLSGSARDQTVGPISFTNPGTTEPSVLIFPVAGDGVATYPARNSQSTGSAQAGWVNLESWRVTYSITNSQITLRFYTQFNTRPPQGVRVILFRRS